MIVRAYPTVKTSAPWFSTLKDIALAADTLATMTKRSLRALLLVALCAPALALPAASAAGDHSRHRATTTAQYQPDEWIKLCGLSTGCTVGPPPPHPWHGNGIYNTSGSNQTIRVRMEDGEGVRFWIMLQNDGASSDTFTVLGCKGGPRFVINAVLVGMYKRPLWGPRHITKQFKDGTAKFTLAAGSQVALTLNIVAPTAVEGITYHCPVTIASSGDPTLKDTVVGVITTT
jgi:hypothetical protein